jgi:plastocyanin
MRLIAALSISLFAACGGDPEDPAIMDAPMQQADAAGAVVALATCPTSVQATMVTNASAFSPTSVTVAPGGVIKLQATVGHQIGPNPLTTSDPALAVPQGGTKCFQLNATGTFGIICTFHSFAGTITVQ